MPELQTKTLELSNGKTIPVVGLGTWKSKPEAVESAVRDAIEAGYRHIDAAYVYGNEDAVGRGIQACIDAGVITRDELFVTTKLWCTFHRPDLVEGHLDQSLANLKLDYVDLYLMHWPMALQEGGDSFPRDEAGNPLLSDVDYLDTYNAMQKCVDSGRTRSIGLSNFNIEQTQRILDSKPTHLPVNLQVEISPYLPNTELFEWARAHGIVVTAYSPFGSPDRPWADASDRVLFDEPKVKAIATAHNKSPAQVLIRWGIQRGYVIIPKSVTKQRIIANSQVFDFELSPEEMASLLTFEPIRACVRPWMTQSKYFPF